MASSEEGQTFEEFPVGIAEEAGGEEPKAMKRRTCWMSKKSCEQLSRTFTNTKYDSVPPRLQPAPPAVLRPAPTHLCSVLAPCLHGKSQTES